MKKKLSMLTPKILKKELNLPRKESKTFDTYIICALAIENIKESHLKQKKNIQHTYFRH
jgi:hypothetical protein